MTYKNSLESNAMWTDVVRSRIQMEGVKHHNIKFLDIAYRSMLAGVHHVGEAG
jgi:hypothetical protein